MAFIEERTAEESVVITVALEGPVMGLAASAVVIVAVDAKPPP